MTISSTIRTAGPYAGTGVQQVFPFSFKVFVATDLLVLLTVSGSSVIQALTTQYTVSLNADQNATPGGTVTMLAAPATGATLNLSSQVPELQPTDLANVGSFYPKAVTDALDRNVILVQQLEVKFQGALRAPTGELISNLPPASSRANSVLGFDANGNPIATLPASGSGTQLAFDLINSTDPTRGAALVARATAQIQTLAVLRTTAGRYASDAVYMERVISGYDAGDGNFLWDAASVVADNGVTIVAVAGVPTGRWKRRYHYLTFGMFGCKATPGFDNSTAFAAICTFLNALNTASAAQPEILAEEGRYEFSASPNWGIQNASINPTGNVYLRNTGTGPSVILDGGAASGGVYAVKMGNKRKFIVEGGPTSQDGVFARAVLQDSHLGFQVNGAGTTYSGINILFSVCGKFDLVCSNNVQGYTWYSKPAKGLNVTGRGAGELSSYCIFPNPIFENCGAICVNLDFAQGNLFQGGTMEGASSVGLFLTANTIKNKVEATDFEVNTSHDIYCLGRGNEFYGVNTQTQITFDTGAVVNKVIGGTHCKILANTGTVHNLISGATYNQNNDGSNISDLSGGKLRLRDNYNQGVGRMENSPPGSPFNIPPTGSTFTYTNVGDNEVDIMVSGGTVSGISFTRNSSTVVTGVVAGMWRLTTNDSLNISYTGAPVITGFSR